MTGDRTSEHCLTSHVGAGSSSHCLHVARRSDATTSSAVTVAPKVSSGETSRTSTVGWPAAAADARMAAIFPLKNIAKSLAENGLRTAPDDRQTDGRAIAYSEREREFTFAKKVWSR